MMIQTFVNRFMDKNTDIADKFKKKHPKDYIDIVKIVIEAITSDDYNDIDPNRIHIIDDGDYQGTLLYIIGAKGYQPSDYWYVMVDYGSCSACDTLQSIHNYSDYAPSRDDVKQYMTLALHIVQRLKKIDDKE